MKKGSLLKRGKLIATVGTITGFKAVGAKKLQVEFGSAVAEASKASLTIKRGNSPVAGKFTWDAESKVATFVSDTILPAGDYTATIGTETPAALKVEAEKADKIEIKDQPVLTGTSDASKNNSRSNDEAYIYYDVLNQYGESIRERATVNWSITSCDTSRDNKNLGLVVVHRKNDREIFTYGTEIHVTAVCIKDGTTVTDNKTLKIGEIQAIDKIEYKGFSKRSYHDRTLDRKNVKDIQDTVPADFPTDTWSLLYQAYDQNGNMLEPAKDNISSEKEGAKLTFISDQPTLVMNNFADGEIYKVNEGEETAEYSSVNIEPGMYIDRETKVGLKAISTRTGQKNEKEFTIGDTQRLQSFKIETPSHVVADGDITELPYTAIDTAGNNIKDYKTIARSSNILSFSASEGTLRLTENDDGTAKLEWADDSKYRPAGNPYSDGGIIINDNVDRTISLTAVVTGKESASNTTTLAVSDMRRPHTIQDVRFGVDGNDTVIAGFEKQEVNIVDDITYTDQYGEILNNDEPGTYGVFNRVSNFWNAAGNDSIRGYSYSIRAKQLSGSENYTIFNNKKSGGNGSVPGTNPNPTDDVDNAWGSGGYTGSSSSKTNSDVLDIMKVVNNENKYIHHNARYMGNASNTIVKPSDSHVTITDKVQATVSYSIVESEKTNNSSYNDIGKTRTETYTIVPLSKVSDFTIKTVKDKLGIKTRNTDYPNGSYVNNIGNTDSAKDTMGQYIDTNNVTGAAIDIITKSKDTDALELMPDTGNQANKIKVESKYQGKTLTVPFMYIQSTEKGPWGKVYDGKVDVDGTGQTTEVKNYRGVTSGSALSLSTNATSINNISSSKNGSSNTLKDTYVSTIDKIREWQIRWEDLYDVNTARYTRKDANLALQLYIDENPDKYYLDQKGKPVDGTSATIYKTITDNGKSYREYKDGYNNGTVVEKRITISDAPEQAANIKFLETTIPWRPENTAIENDDIKNDKIKVYDQYGQENDGGRKVLYTVSDYTENPDGRLEKNYTIDKNGSNGSVVNGVERGDSYTLTANLENSGLTAKATIKAGGDDAAVIESSKVMSQSSEYTLRNKYLGYNR